MKGFQPIGDAVEDIGHGTFGLCCTKAERAADGQVPITALEFTRLAQDADLAGLGALLPHEKVGDSGSFLASFRLAYGILQTGLQIEVSISEQGLSLLKFLCGRSRAAFPSRRPAGDAS